MLSCSRVDFDCASSPPSDGFFYATNTGRTTGLKHSASENGMEWSGVSRLSQGFCTWGINSLVIRVVCVSLFDFKKKKKKISTWRNQKTCTLFLTLSRVTNKK